MEPQMNHLILCGVAYMLAIMSLLFVECLNCYNIKDKQSAGYLKSISAIKFYGKSLIIGIIALFVLLLTGISLNYFII